VPEHVAGTMADLLGAGTSRAEEEAYIKLDQLGNALLYGNKGSGGVVDTTTVSYTEAREHLAELWDRVTEGRAPIRPTRRGAPAVVLVAEEEYQGLLETAHLLRSPANAARLLRALQRALAEEGMPGTLAKLRKTFDRA